MRATQSLPPAYRKIGTLDVSKNDRLLLILNLVGLVSMGIFGFLFFWLLVRMRPNEGLNGVQLLQISTTVGWVGLIAAIIGLTVLHILLHEAIHGIFFWIYTRSRPHFAFRWAYAYAAAPDWFIARNPFLVTTLAPFVVMSAAGVLIMRFAPPAWLLATWFVITMNAGGAVGDMIVAGWLLRQPQTCLAQDCGDAVTLFVPE